jgi:hypothetical protein
MMKRKKNLMKKVVQCVGCDKNIYDEASVVYLLNDKFWIIQFDSPVVDFSPILNCSIWTHWIRMFWKCRGKFSAICSATVLQWFTGFFLLLTNLWWKKSHIVFAHILLREKDYTCNKTYFLKFWYFCRGIQKHVPALTC